MDLQDSDNTKTLSQSKKINYYLLVVPIIIVAFAIGCYFAPINSFIRALFVKQIEVDKQTPKSWQTYTLPQYQLQFKSPFKPNSFMHIGNEGLIWDFGDWSSVELRANRLEILVMKNNENLNLNQLLTTKLGRNVTLEEKFDIREVRFNSILAYYYKTKNDLLVGSEGKYSYVYSENENLAFVYNKHIYVFKLKYSTTIYSDTSTKPSDNQLANAKELFNDNTFEQFLGSVILSRNDPKYVPPTITPTPTMEPKIFREIVKFDQSGAKVTIVNSVSDEQKKRQVIKISQWENYLFIYEVETKRIEQAANSYRMLKKLYIRTHDLKTGLDYNLGTINADRFDRVYQKQIGNKLYITLPAFTDEYGLYFVNLPPVDKIIRVTNKGNISNITLIGQNHYLVGGFGDSCFSNTSYNLFYPESNTVFPGFNHFNGCGYGPYVFNFEDSGTILMADRVEEVPDPFQYQGLFYGIFKNIYRIDPKNPSVKDILISNEQMPKNARFAEFFKNKNKLIIYGDGVYEFDIASKSLEYIVPPPEKGLLGFSVINYEDNTICASYFRLSGDIEKDQNTDIKGKYILINTKNKRFKESQQPCKYPKDKYKYSNDNPFDINKQVEKLKLPDNYKVIYN